MQAEDRSSCFTDSTILNFFILVVLPLPGILAYLLVDYLVGGEPLLRVLPVAVGLVVLVAVFPLSLRFIKWLKEVVNVG